MREYTVTIDRAKGLRKNFKARRNEFELFDCLNLKPTERGYMPFEVLENPFGQNFLASYNITLNWPFPQLFVGMKRTFLADRKKIYLVDPLDWSMPLFELEPTSGSLVTGRAWSFIDLHDFFIFTNGQCSLIYLNAQGMTGGSSANTLVATSAKTVECGTYHKGRVIMGGFDYANFWSSTWRTFWQTWETKRKDTALEFNVEKPEGTYYAPVDGNFIWWSMIGGGDLYDFFLDTYQATGYLASSHTTAKPFILEMLRRNDWGFAAMPFQGKVREIVPLGDWLIVYTDGGVQALRGVSDPEPTYAQFTLTKAGIANKGAVAGSNQRHVYVDQGGTLWEISGSPPLARPLGYREFFLSMLGSDIQVSHSEVPLIDSADTSFGEFYIGTFEKTYVLNQEGLFRTSQLVTSSVYFQGRNLGLGSSLEDSEEPEGLLVFDEFDFHRPGLKTVESVSVDVREVSYLGPTANIKVALDYRYKKTDLFSTTSYKALNDEGEVYFPVAGLDFRLRLKLTNFFRFDIADIRINYKLDDKRYSRSVDVSSLGTSADR